MRGRKPLNQTGAAARIIRCWLGISVDKLVIDLEIAGHPICRSSIYRIKSRQKYFTDVEMMAYVKILPIRAGLLFMEPKELPIASPDTTARAPAEDASSQKLDENSPLLIRVP